MKRYSILLITFSGFLLFSCNEPTAKNDALKVNTTKQSINLLTDVIPRNNDNSINAIIEVPSGTVQKWELNKSTGQIEWEKVNGKHRVLNYIGYPGNYGMIPQTLLSKENGGDGDPLDILVLGPPEKRGAVVKSKIIGVLYLLDRGEQDDKLIAVSANSKLYDVNSINELNEKYKGVSEIIQLWFSNYKGPGKLVSKGFGDRSEAEEILQSAITDYSAK